MSATAMADIDASKQLRRAVIASTVGTTIEWYDFFLHTLEPSLHFAGPNLILPKLVESHHSAPFDCFVLVGHSEPHLQGGRKL